MSTGDPEVELRRAYRALKVLSAATQALLHAGQESDLLNDVCRIAVEAGGYRFAWIGYAEQDQQKTVRPVAQAGFEDGYLDTVNVTWADTERGRGPTGAAIRTGKASVARNIPNDPNFEPWRAAALQRGYASSIALPLIAEGQAMGALMIYAAEPDALGAEEELFLTELADSLAYGIMSLRTRAQAKQAQEALRKREARLQLLIARMPVGAITWDPEFHVTSWNPAAEMIFGFRADEALGKHPYNLIVPNEDQPLVDTVWQRLLEGDQTAHSINENVTKDGRTITCDWTNTPLRDDHTVIGVLSMVQDITERKRGEEQVKRQLNQLSALHEIDIAIIGSTDLLLVIKTIVEQTIAQLEVDAADILLYNPHTLTLDYGAGHGFRGEGVQLSSLRIGEGLGGQVALEQKALIVHNLPEHGDFVRAGLLADEGFTDYSGVPLIARGEIKGVLEAFDRTHRERDHEWRSFLEALAAQSAIALDNAGLFDSLQRSNLELAMAYDATIEGWSRAMDMRDRETEGHTKRVTEMTLQLARMAGIGNAELAHIKRGALLHDMGKLGVPDSILLKAGKLTDQEWEIMRKHPTYAREMLSPIAYLRPALDIPYCHHEKWDGTGYPRGLKGDQIPLAARLFAPVDVWDALRSDRPYRPAWPEEKAREHICANGGTHFDPEAVDLFLRAKTT